MNLESNVPSNIVEHLKKTSVKAVVCKHKCCTAGGGRIAGVKLGSFDLNGLDDDIATVKFRCVRRLLHAALHTTVSVPSLSCSSSKPQLRCIGGCFPDTVDLTRTLTGFSTSLLMHSTSTSIHVYGTKQEISFITAPRVTMMCAGEKITLL